MQDVAVICNVFFLPYALFKKDEAKKACRPKKYSEASAQNARLEDFAASIRV